MTSRTFFAILISMILLPGPAAWAQQQPGQPAKTAATKYLKMGADPQAPLRLPDASREDVVVASEDVCSTWGTGSGKTVTGCYPAGTAFYVDRATGRATGALCGNVDKAEKPVRFKGKVIPRESVDYEVIARRVAEEMAEQVLAKVKPSVTNNNISTGIQRVEVQAPEGTVLDRVETNQQQPGQPATEVVVKLKSAPPLAVPPPPLASLPAPAVKERSRCGRGCVIGIIAASAGAAAAAAFLGGRSGAKSVTGCNSCTATPPLTRP